MRRVFDTAEAQAARELFYFIGEHPGSTRQTVLKAWQDANLGLALENLDQAVSQVASARASMEKPQERYGFYSIQRTFLRFIEGAGLREELVPDGRGEVVFYNLGKFSQLISDFETIHYHSQPKEKYLSFANFLQFHAESAYPEG